MKLYEVISEEIGEVVPILEDGSGPTEYYQIWRLIAARNRSQARYLAWKTDSHFKKWGSRLTEMPHFRVRKLVGNLSNKLQPGDYTKWD